MGIITLDEFRKRKNKNNSVLSESAINNGVQTLEQFAKRKNLDLSSIGRISITKEQQSNTLSQISERKNASQHVIQTVGTFEEYAAEMRKNNPTLFNKMADKGESQLKQSYQKLIESKEKSLSGTKDFSGLTNIYYQQYLENFKANATEQKQKDWLNKQYENLVALQNPEIRKSIQNMYGNDNLLGFGKYREGKETLEGLGYGPGDIDSLIDTYKRESNAKSNAKMKARAEDMTDTAGGSIFAQFLSHGAKMTSGLGVLKNAAATVKEWWLDEYEPTDTNSYLYTSGDFSDKARHEIEKNITKEDEYVEQGEKVPTLNKVAGMAYQAGTSVADSILHGGLGAPGMALMGAEAATSTSKDVFERTGSNAKALASGAASGTIEALTEKFSLDHLWDIAKGTGKAFTRKAFVNLVAQSGIEASEEIASEGLNTLVDNWINGKDSNYELNVQSYIEQGMSEEEARDKAFVDAWKQIGKAGASGAMAGIMGGGIATGFNKVANTLSDSDKKVVDAEVQNRINEKEANGTKVTSKEKKKIKEQVRKDLEKGYISTDTIESVLGGKTYEEYKAYVDKKAALEKEIEDIRKMPMSEFTVADEEHLRETRQKLNELKKSTNEQQLKQRLSEEVQGLAQGNYIGESYNEKGRRSQAFRADISTYDKKMQATVRKAIESGMLNDTNRTHELVDFLAKISADKGVSFDFTNNQRLKDTGLIREGLSVNGYVKDGNVTLNLNSAKALNKVVGHEITHVLEGTEHYQELQSAIFEYAKSKNDYDRRYQTLTELYKDVENANIEQELAADLIGDYLFSDEAFVQHLSSKNRNIFQKIYDEIKYLIKTVTSGSKEAKQLEKVKKTFEKVYQDSVKIEVNDRVQYSLVGTDENGIEIYETSEETKKLSYSERNKLLLKSVLEDYKGRTAKFHKNGEVYYALYNEQGVRKGVYGDKKSDLSGRKAKTNIGADGNYIELAENALYTGTSAEQGKQTNNDFHSDAKTWDYYEKTIKSDGKYYDVLINVKDTGNEQYVYDITLKEASLPHRTNLYKRGKLASKDSIPKTAENATEKQGFSLISDNILPTGDWNIKGEDVALAFPTAEEVAPVQQKEQRKQIVPIFDGKKEQAENSLEEAVSHQEDDESENAKESTSTKFSRKEYHKGIIDNIKQQFANEGFNFDNILSDANNKSTWASVDNTPQRFIEKTLGYKEGQILNDLTVNQIAQNESKAIQWLNSFTDRKNGFLAQISKQYGIKPGSRESAAAQMYGEGFWVNEAGDYVKYGDEELSKDFKDPRIQRNIKALANDPRVRQAYDDTLNRINESRMRNGYPEIPRMKNYYLHYRVMDDAFSRLGIPFNPNDIRMKDLPTDLNGVTADLKPGQPYFASAMQRKGKRTTYDLLGGMERYMASAKNQIFHIDDIQTLRALRNYVADSFGQAKGFEGLDELTQEEVNDRIEKICNSHLSTFAKFLNEEANILAGKTSLIDRGLEGIIGRKGITFLDSVNKQVGSNMVGMNISSSLTNLVSVVQGFAKVNKFDFVKAFTQTVSNKVSSIGGQSDGFTEINPLIMRRKGAEKFIRTPYEKVKDSGYILAGAIDNFSTELIVRAKYNELTRKGMDSTRAHVEADKWASRILGDRSLGQQPQLYNSKMLGLFTKFQLEVRNQLDSMLYDTIQEAKLSTEEIQDGLQRNTIKAAKIGSTFLQLAIGQHLFGQVFESIAGYNPAFDIIEILIKMFGFDDEEDSEDSPLDNIEQGCMALLEDLPYTSTFTGGRIPIASALPVKEIITGTDQYGNDKSRWETAAEALPYYLLPTGYGQIKKTTQGLKMFGDELPIAGSYTDSGKLRFPVEDNIKNRVQAAVFGQYASENARNYFDQERQALNEKQTQEYADLYKDSGMSIQEYWSIRDNLKQMSKFNDKADYIANLDIPDTSKNILVNNVTTRKEEVDLTGYDSRFGDFEEFDFYVHNPGEYKIATAVGGYKRYATYKKTIGSITGNKDSSGKTITGSRKEKVIDYINGLSLNYGDRILLFKNAYPQDNRYNKDIVEYLNERDDISADDMETILKELGFTVEDDGTVRW